MYTSKRRRVWLKGSPLESAYTLVGMSREHARRTFFAFVLKDAIAHLPLPASVPLGGPYLGEASQHLIVTDLNSVTLNHHVQPIVP